QDPENPQAGPPLLHLSHLLQRELEVAPLGRRPAELVEVVDEQLGRDLAAMAADKGRDEALKVPGPEVLGGRPRRPIPVDDPGQALALGHAGEQPRGSGPRPPPPHVLGPTRLAELARP